MTPTPGKPQAHPSATAAPTTKPGTARASYANGELRRDQIIDAAMAVFGEQGFTRTSLRTIAERAGTSHVSLMHHFGSKEVLFQRVLERRETLNRAALSDEFAAADLEEAVAMMMRRNVAAPGLVHLDTTVTAEAIIPTHPAHAYIERVFADFVSEVTARLEREQAAGQLREGLNLPVVARQFVALLEGIQTQWLYDPGVDMELHMQEFLKLLKR